MSSKFFPLYSALISARHMARYGESHVYFLKTQSFGFGYMYGFGSIYIYVQYVHSRCPQGLEKKLLELQTVINSQSRTWVL